MDAFAIGRYPVTNAEYAAFSSASAPRRRPGGRIPTSPIPSSPSSASPGHEAVAFCDWLSGVEGRPVRLPTEAEWEKAARGGVEDARFPWGDAHPGTGRAERPPRVTEGKPNPLGLHALSGVCHEWCLDWDDAGYYAVSPERNPPGPSTGTRRVSRGGAWRHQDPWSPVAHRSSLPPALRYSDYGFRVVSPGVSG